MGWDAPDPWEEALPVFDAPDLSGWEEVLPVFDAPDPALWDVSANMPSRTQLDGGTDDGSPGTDADPSSPDPVRI
jgi:hypothetical protein